MILKHNVCFKLPWTIAICVIITARLVVFFKAALEVIGKADVESIFEFEAR